MPSTNELYLKSVRRIVASFRKYEPRFGFEQPPTLVLERVSTSRGSDEAHERRAALIEELTGVCSAATSVAEELAFWGALGGGSSDAVISTRADLDAEFSGFDDDPTPERSRELHTNRTPCAPRRANDSRGSGDGDESADAAPLSVDALYTDVRAKIPSPAQIAVAAKATGARKHVEDSLSRADQDLSPSSTDRSNNAPQATFAPSKSPTGVSDASSEASLDDRTRADAAQRRQEVPNRATTAEAASDKTSRLDGTAVPAAGDSDADDGNDSDEEDEDEEEEPPQPAIVHTFRHPLHRDTESDTCGGCRKAAAAALRGAPAAVSPGPVRLVSYPDLVVKEAFDSDDLHESRVSILIEDKRKCRAAGCGVADTKPTADSGKHALTFHVWFGEDWPLANAAASENGGLQPPEEDEAAGTEEQRVLANSADKVLVTLADALQLEFHEALLICERSGMESDRFWDFF